MSPIVSRIGSGFLSGVGFGGRRKLSTTTPTYLVSPSTSSVNEGSSVTFTVTTTNVGDGTTLYWTTATVSGTINTSDFNDGVTSGSFTITNNSGSISRTLANDATTEGSESFQIEIRTSSTSGTIVATSSTVTIGDTSLTPTYSVSPSTSSVNEGSSVTFTVSTTNVSNGTTLYWSTYTNSGTINTSDFNDGATTGSFTISGNSGSITRTLANDSTTEGSESFGLYIRTGSTSGTIVATSSAVTIGDTSTAIIGLYSFTSATFTPGGRTGSSGPTLAQAISGLSGTGVDAWKNNTSYFNTSAGIQLWTVPRTGTYTIECVGAAGGGTYTTPGYGARMIGNFSLTQGNVIKILVGQKGLNGTSDCGYGVGGGGGGSFVATNSNSALIVAGGGGGSSSTVIIASRLNGSISTSGNQGDGSLGGAGGSGGNGGSAGSGCVTASSGGGGFTGNGSSSGQGQPGNSFTNGGDGGAGTKANGGFGGGSGTANYTGGGGGGYSGGGGGGLNTCSCNDLNGGGGGGSYNGGSSQYNTSGYNTGDGYVTITFVS